METWKKFEDTELTHSGVHHLAAVYELKREKGYARASDVGKRLKITRGSAFITLKKLKERGYLDEDDNKFLVLTPAARTIVAKTLAARRAARKFFAEILELPEGTAKDDACKIEHLLSPETIEAFGGFLRYFFSNRAEAKKAREGFHRYLAEDFEEELEEMLAEEPDIGK
jgi:Mn-dependent DtxR family transcriptional regulator